MTENLIDIVAHHHQLRSQQFQLITRTMMTPLVKVVSRSVILRGGGRPWLPAAARCKPGTALQSRFKPHTQYNLAANQALYNIISLQTRHCTTICCKPSTALHNPHTANHTHYTICTVCTHQSGHNAVQTPQIKLRCTERTKCTALHTSHT